MLKAVKKIFPSNIKIPSCTVSVTLLKELSSIIEEVSSEAANDEKVKQSSEWEKKSYEPKYEIISKKMKIESITLKELLKEKMQNIE